MKKYVLFLSLILASPSIIANDKAQKAQIDKVVASFNRVIKASRIRPTELGIYVMDQNKAIVDINATKLMVPASLTKIMTGAAVLKKMPLNQAFVTELRSSAKIENGVLKGDLCFKGSGDPSFVSEKMWALVNDFTRTGVKKIEGNIVIDDSRFDDELYDKGRDSVRVDRAYDAPVSATSFNWNSVNVYIRPSANTNEAAQIFLDPYSDYLSLENRTKTVDKKNVKNIQVSRVKFGNKDKIVVTGEISKDVQEIVSYKSITNPAQWTASHFKEFLKQRSIEFTGTVVEAECATPNNLMASVDSKKLIAMASDMLKYSNNYVSEMLAKNLATKTANFEKTGKGATMADGIEGIKSYLDEVGINRKDYILTNVSGLNRKNQFTAKQISTVLNAIKNDFLIFPEFLAGLPIAGLDGTLKDRLKNDERFNLIRAKTGYLDGVVGLGGFVGRQDEAPLVFVFIFNGAADKGLDARVLFDNLSKELLKI